MPFLLAEILNFQGSTHRIGVGSFSKLLFGYREPREGTRTILNNTEKNFRYYLDIENPERGREQQNCCRLLIF